ncbi:hypothetical protein [Nitrosomonas aestuarii]|uniref:hypothetical protein n=1 Tax=Nitrosomonas aestuarii TaxID=52441 RepID=UPI000B83338C|nr:hypothetical protein [Nitrosomonas aestuarii]
MTKKPVFYTRAEAITNAIIDRVGKHIYLAMPLDLDKANYIANALVHARLKIKPFNCLFLPR